jgi:hypothetical protein
MVKTEVRYRFKIGLALASNVDLPRPHYRHAHCIPQQHHIDASPVLQTVLWTHGMGGCILESKDFTSITADDRCWVLFRTKSPSPGIHYKLNANARQPMLREHLLLRR